MSEWITELRSGLIREYDTRPFFATLASVDKSGAPRARTVVCRRVGADGAIYITSDSRSEKNQQIGSVPQAEIVFWLPNLREQYRLGGAAKVLGVASSDPSRLEIWSELSDAARAMFTWPTPGAKRVDPPETFARQLPSDVSPPATFELIVIRPRRVEHLSLTSHPHRRRRWMLAGIWSAASELNP